MTLNLQSFANQEFDFVNGASSYHIRLHTFRGIMYASVTVDESVAVESSRCISHQWIMPMAYAKTGNFRFECGNRNEYPDYKDFGKTCFLKFYTTEDIEAGNVQ